MYKGLKMPFQKSIVFWLMSAVLRLVLGQVQGDDLILGGSDAKMAQAPWQVQVGIAQVGKTESLCGGSILDKGHILTAAHCLQPTLSSPAVDPSKITIYTGSVLRDKGQKWKVQRFTLHPHWDPDKVVNDLAVMELVDKLHRNISRGAVCLPKKAITAYVGRGGMASGWGQRTACTSKPSPRLQIIKNLQILPDCLIVEKLFGPPVPGQFCAGGQKGQGSCEGDSGGPLVIEEAGCPTATLVGVTSSFHVLACGLDSVPNVFTDVAFYRDWLKQVVSPGGSEKRKNKNETKKGI